LKQNLNSNMSVISLFTQTHSTFQTPILWSHGIADRTVLFEAGQAGPPFLQKAGVTCEFKVVHFYMVLFSLSLQLGLQCVSSEYCCRVHFTGISGSWPLAFERRAALSRGMDQESSLSLSREGQLT
jgi:hypothetical protein